MFSLADGGGGTGGTIGSPSSYASPSRHFTFDPNASLGDSDRKQRAPGQRCSSCLPPSHRLHPLRVCTVCWPFCRAGGMCARRSVSLHHMGTGASLQDEHVVTGCQKYRSTAHAFPSLAQCTTQNECAWWAYEVVVIANQSLYVHRMV
jgi:hypothetical protein